MGATVQYCANFARLLKSRTVEASIVQESREKGAGFGSTAENIDTPTSAGQPVFQDIAFIAEFEHDPFSKRAEAFRAKERLASARKQGRIGGRLPVLVPETTARPNGPA